MDWKITAATFGSVLLAEIGDKTQVMTLTLVSAGNSKLGVFVGASAALVATTALAVLVGQVATQLVPVVWLRRAAGLLFVLMGAYFLWSSRPGAACELASHPDDGPGAAAVASEHQPLGHIDADR